MNKKELVSAVAQKTGIYQKDVNEVLDAIIENITSTLKAKEKITIIGFGTFKTQEKDSRLARNPKTGQEIKIPPTTIAKFKPGSALKNEINIITSKVKIKQKNANKEEKIETKKTKNKN